MRVLVCGGRDYRDRLALNRTLDQFHTKTPITHLIHGAARGADTLANDWALSHSIPVTPYPAEWDKHGRKAGYLRNVQMLTEGKPSHVIAFPGGPGTASMIALSRRASLPVTLLP